MPRHPLTAIIAALLLTTGCANHHQHGATSEPANVPAMSKPAASQAVAMAMIGPSKIATTMPSSNHVMGSVIFTQSGDQVQVVADLTGFAPNSVHGFHIHAKGDLSASDLSSAGPHFDPMHTMHHGDPTAMGGMKHAGDLGNLTADAAGNVHYEITVTGVTIGAGPADILGKSVIIHGKADDLKSQPAGDSGARIAGGVIKSTMQ